MTVSSVLSMSVYMLNVICACVAKIHACGYQSIQMRENGISVYLHLNF